MLPPYINVRNFFSKEKPGWIGKDLLPSYYDVIDLSATLFFNDIVIDLIIIHKSYYILIIVLYVFALCYVTLMHSSRLKTMDIPTSSILILSIKNSPQQQNLLKRALYAVQVHHLMLAPLELSFITILCPEIRCFFSLSSKMKELVESSWVLQRCRHQRSK